MDLDSIDNLLSKRMNKLGLNNEFQAAYVLSQANALADGRFEAVRFLHGNLTLSCPSSIAAQEIKFIEKDLINKINEKIKPQQIKRISYRIKS